MEESDNEASEPEKEREDVTEISVHVVWSFEAVCQEIQGDAEEKECQDLR